MPTYEYACKACDHNFEIVQSFSEDSLTTCPECEQDALRKVYNAAGIIFKGDGWHIKDYASSGAPASTSSDTDSSSAGGDSTSSADGDTTTGDTSETKKTTTKKKAKKDGSGASSSGTASKPAAS